MFYLKKVKSTGRYELNILGLKMKFRLGKKKNNLYKERLDNLIYELADPRTLENIKLPTVLSLNDTLYTVIASNKSLARYGDGEFKIIMGESISFQKYDKNLSDRLKEILKNKNENLFVGLTDTFGYCPDAYFKRVMTVCRKTLYEYIDFSKTYVNSNLTRQFIFATEEQGKDYYNKIKSLWNEKDIVIVEGAGSRLGIGNDLFDNASSVKRIISPIKDAFSNYNEILSVCLKQPEDTLFILALGPTATVLADDLSNAGYRALDAGHIDTAYEAFLRKAKRFVPVEGKIVFNEERHKSLLKPCKDKNYYSQIISTIG